MSEGISKRAEDYLEAILVLRRDGGSVRVSEIAAYLGVTKPSVVAAIRLLKDDGMVTQAPYQGVLLTTRGQDLARLVFQRHESIRAFLVRILGVSPEAAEKDACRMEHFLQAETLEQMKLLIKSVETCPESGPKCLVNFLGKAPQGQGPRDCCRNFVCCSHEQGE